MINSIENSHKYIIKILKDICIKSQASIYIVGGAVRDFILGIPSKDIDICTETDILSILKQLESIDSEITYKYYEKFQTSTIYYKEISIDLIRCRREIYSYNGALPETSPSNLFEDLKRRDFTINAIAYDIVKDSYVDYFNGREDLKNGLIKKVHEKSYSEDATRIFRAVKYANRLNFKIFDEAEIKEVIDSDIMNSISCDRFIKELKLILEEHWWLNNIIKLKKFNIINYDENKLNKEYFYISNNDFEDRFLRLFLSLNNEILIESLINNSVIDKSIKKSLKRYSEEKDETYYKLKNSKTNYEIYVMLKQFDNTNLKLLSSEDEFFFKIYNYLRTLKELFDASIIKKYNIHAKEGREIENILKKYNNLRLNLITKVEYDDFLKMEESFGCR